MNKADIGGVFFLTEQSIVATKLISSRNFFKYNNFANFYGEFFSNVLKNLKFVNDNANIIKLKNIVSGKIYKDCIFKIQAIDIYGNIA